MSESSVVENPPISGWDPELRSIVRCLEALDAEQKEKALVHDGRSDGPSRGLYGGLICKIEEFLFTERRGKSWGMKALAELAIAGYALPDDRHIGHLFAAAEAGHLNAQLELAHLADDQRIPPPGYFGADNDREMIARRRCYFNAEQSDRWWKVAAENDSALAQYRVGCELIESDSPVEFAEGVAWLRKAAGNRIPHPAAQYELAYLTELGCIAPDDPEYRWRAYEAAANAEVPEAMLAAAHYLEHGIGVDRDTKAASDWYRKAAKLAHDEDEDEGEDEGGHLYLLAGKLSDSDSDFEEAADAGNVEAMLIMARRELRRGYGTFGLDEFLSGINYLERAASSDCLEAVLELAEIYEDGGYENVIPEDWECRTLFNMHATSERLENALGWYERAQELGCKPAAANIERIQKLLESGDEDAGPDD